MTIILVSCYNTNELQTLMVVYVLHLDELSTGIHFIEDYNRL